MLNNGFFIFTFIGKLTAFESWLLIALCLFAGLFLALAIVIFLSRKRGKSTAHTVLSIVSLVLLLLLIGCGFMLLYVLKDSKNDFIVKLTKAYNNRLIIIPYLVLLASLLLCFSVILFLPETTEGSSNKAVVNAKNQFFIAEATEDDEEIEAAVVNDAFKEFGNSESDVQNCVDRIAEKLTKKTNETPIDSALSKDVVFEIDQTIEGSKNNDNGSDSENNSASNEGSNSDIDTKLENQ